MELTQEQWNLAKEEGAALEAKSAESVEEFEQKHKPTSGIEYITSIKMVHGVPDIVTTRIS